MSFSFIALTFIIIYLVLFQQMRKLCLLALTLRLIESSHRCWVTTQALCLLGHPVYATESAELAHVPGPFCRLVHRVFQNVCMNVFSLQQLIRTWGMIWKLYTKLRTSVFYHKSRIRTGCGTDEPTGEYAVCVC